MSTAVTELQRRVAEQGAEMEALRREHEVQQEKAKAEMAAAVASAAESREVCTVRCK